MFTGEIKQCPCTNGGFCAGTFTLHRFKMQGRAGLQAKRPLMPFMSSRVCVPLISLQPCTLSKFEPKTGDLSLHTPCTTLHNPAQEVFFNEQTITSPYR